MNSLPLFHQNGRKGWAHPSEATAVERLRMAEKERDRLRASLERYGAHQDGCEASPLALSRRCTCGYHAALAFHCIEVEDA